jgi:hypothetical protein
MAERASHSFEQIGLSHGLFSKYTNDARKALPAMMAIEPPLRPPASI